MVSRHCAWTLQKAQLMSLMSTENSLLSSAPDEENKGLKWFLKAYTRIYLSCCPKVQHLDNTDKIGNIHSIFKCQEPWQFLKLTAP